MSMSAQYFEAARTAQERWVATLQNMANEAQSALPSRMIGVDTDQLSKQTHDGIDQIFDFWAKSMKVQRDIARKIADANIEYLAALQGQALAVSQQATEQVKEATAQVAEVTRQAQDQVAEAAAKAEESMANAANSAARAAKSSASRTSSATSTDK